MLEKYSKIINLVNYSNIGDKRICQFYANINSDDPINMDMGRAITEKDAYKANRVQVMKDQAEFETMAYTLQDEMIAANQPAESEAK